MDHTGHLLRACEEGNISIVTNVLDKGTDVNVTDVDDCTPLQVASANGQEHVVRLLLMRGAALDQANSFGWTPLLLAARHGHVSVVELLLQNQADLNAKTKLGANAITLAARGGHLQTCKLLIEAGVDLNPSTGIGNSSCEFTPLMVAAHHGHDSVVRCLLDRGCDINHRTPSMGINALMLAALNGYMTTSQILVERGADPNLTNINDHTPLQVATAAGKDEVQGYLDRKTTNKKNVVQEDIKLDIIEAAKAGNLTRLKEILNDDPMQRDACSPQDGATPLMFAAMTGHLDIVKLLVEKGCDINKQDPISGWTALMQATYHGKNAVAKYLIQAGANVLIPAKNGCTAFYMASLIDDVDVEMYRMMAAKAATVTYGDKKPKGRLSRANGTWTGSVSVISDKEFHSDRPKSGLKAWWNRMSNRFRNLKMGRSFNMNANRVGHLPNTEVISNAKESATRESTLKSSPKRVPRTPQKSISAVDRLISSSTSNLSTLSSYQTIMLETKKSAALYTLEINSQSANIQDGNLKPVKPPFLPPPTYGEDRPKMPPTSTRRSVSSLGSTSTLTQTSTRPIIPPMKLLKRYSASTQNLAASPVSPAPSVKFDVTDVNSPKLSTRFSLQENKYSHIDSVSRSSYNEDASPSSSAGASAISGSTYRSKGPSSASSSTLTAGSDNIYRSGGESARSNDPLFMTPSRTHRPPSYPPSASYQRAHVAFSVHSHISPNSSTGGSSGVAYHKHGSAKSRSSSKDSASTLTPSPSPVPKVTETDSGQGSGSSSCNQKPADLEETDPSGILKKLSLEHYQPIFEEQEVDMEAFLTLTDQDLTELGICHTDSRRQILTAITELNSGKGRERQHLQETMSNFQTTADGFSVG
ncbi:hypothetical protein LSH36_69g01014 [Paralvinella palmiformis]|uniref:SAM domain-containing protein n=1 Tax=Paralvinella palmiformis TaxID=53620 RepID=A0AAD9K3F2_9ANNE|nr:hypothetical protein LSH36_69g01014 [Paralvinella palmiformis]